MSERIPMSRRSFLVTSIGAALVAPSLGSAQARLPVEDWNVSAPGARGIPAGWEPYETPGGHPAYDFVMVEAEGRRALQLQSPSAHSTIAKRLRIDLEKVPMLEWSWKVLTLPTGGDVRRRETADVAADVLVVWPRFPALLRSRLIGYAWDASAPVGTVIKNPKTSMVTFVIVESGSSRLGQWITERRNVAADYRRIFGEMPPAPGVIALSIDTNDTRSYAESVVGAIAFTTG